MNKWTIIHRDNLKRWRAWDWEKQDCELEDEHGVCRERIRQIRKSVGAPPSPNRYRKRTAMRYQITQKFKAGVPARIEVVARVLGISRHYASALMQQAGIPANSDARIYDWAKVDWAKPNRVIGNELGCQVQVVASYRYIHHKPHPEERMGAWLIGKPRNRRTR